MIIKNVAKYVNTKKLASKDSIKELCTHIDTLPPGMLYSFL